MLTLILVLIAFAAGAVLGRKFPTALAAAQAEAVRVETAIKAKLHLDATVPPVGGPASAPAVVAAAAK